MAEKGKSFESSFDGDGNKSNNDKLGDSSSGVIVSDDFEKDFNVNTSAFEVLERDFQDVVSELMGESSLEKFRLEYEKLHRALRKSHEQEKRLVKKCRELNSEILNNQAKIKTALRLSQEDQKTIAHLQKEMEKTWKLVYTSQEKEARATETISTLKDEMLNLAALVEKGALVGSDQEVLVAELKQMNEELNHQVTKQAHVVQEYDHTIQHLTKINQELLKEKELAVSNIDSLAEELDAQEKELMKVTRKRDKLIKEFESASTTLEDNKRVIDKLTEDTRLSRSQNIELSAQLKESKAVIQKHLKEYEALFTKSSKVTEDLEAQIQKNKEKRAECINLENELKYVKQEVARLSSEKTLWERKYEKEARDVSHYKEMAESSKIPLVIAKQEIETLKNDILLLHREENELMKKNEFIAREKEKQMQQTERAEGKIKENLNMIQQHTRIENNLVQEMNTYKEEIVNLRKTIGSLERDREKLSQEISNQRNNYLSSEEEIKMRDMQINELNIKVLDGEAKLKYQLQLYESLRYDRNNISKSLIDITDECNEMKKNIKIYLQQISQLKDELSIKEQVIAKEQYETAKLEKVKESLQLELQRKNILFSNDHELVDHHEAEIKKLTNLIKKVEVELYDQKIAYDHLINERDVIGLQLIRRNDEIALLVEKIRVQESALKAGENQYNERLNDIQLLKAKIRDITREYNLTKNSGIKIADMKRNILQLERDLLQERTRVTALSEELENPMNIHRWRKLEGSDPATYELILKVQMLQKKLISKSEEVVEKGILLNEKDQLYLELQEVLKRQPGPEVAEQMTSYQRNLKTKNTQMKIMISELNMYQAQSHEYKYEMERLSKEVQDLKRKYFQQKRADESNNASQQLLSAGYGSSNNNNNYQSSNNQNQDSSDNLYTDYNYKNNSNNNSTPLFSRSSPVKLANSSSSTTGAVFSAGGNANAVMMAGGVRSSGKASVAGGGFAIKQPVSQR